MPLVIPGVYSVVLHFHPSFTFGEDTAMSMPYNTTFDICVILLIIALFGLSKAKPISGSAMEFYL